MTGPDPTIRQSLTTGPNLTGPGRKVPSVRLAG